MRIAIIIHGQTSIFSHLDVQPTLINRVKATQSEDPQLKNIVDVVSAGRLEFRLDDDGALWFGQRLYVPNVVELKKEIMRKGHSYTFSAHPGSTKMYRDLK